LIDELLGHVMTEAVMETVIEKTASLTLHDAAIRYKRQSVD